jgi:hypothetical protein
MSLISAMRMAGQCRPPPPTVKAPHFRRVPGPVMTGYRLKQNDSRATFDLAYYMA